MHEIEKVVRSTGAIQLKCKDCGRLVNLANPEPPLPEISQEEWDQHKVAFLEHCSDARHDWKGAMVP